MNTFLAKRRSKVRNSVKLIRFPMSLSSAEPLYMGCIFIMRVVSLGKRCFLFSFHIQCSHLTNSARIARNEKRLAPRLARSIRKQQVINRAPAGHYQPFKHPHVTRCPPISTANCLRYLWMIFLIRGRGWARQFGVSSVFFIVQEITSCFFSCSSV